MPDSLNPRVRMREILDALYDPDDVDALRLPDLVDDVTRQIDLDEGLRWAVQRQVVDVFVREIVQRRVAQTRGLILMGDEVVSRAAFEARVVQRAKRFERWLEHAGDRHIQLLVMRKSDLLVAAAERERRGMDELKIAALWRSLAAGLTDTEQVGDHYSPDEIARLAERLKVTVVVDESNGPVVIDDNPDGVPPGGGPPTPTPSPRRPRTNPTPPADRVRAPAQPRLRRSA